ncbi:hypothetical protein HLB42_03845 [Deinococcus sp. D7000]|nr:hypothetical protein HLB42_03845 [Deinococcus sp. D7000]
MLSLLAPLAQPTLDHTTWTLTSLSFGAVTGHTGCSPLKASVRARGQALLLHNIDAGSAGLRPDHAVGLREDFTTLLARARATACATDNSRSTPGGTD